MLVQAPPPTRFDLRFTFAGVPIRVHPLFWIMIILFGASTGDVLQLLMWIPVASCSILIHELGHAVALRLHGQPSRIVLHVAGGLTTPEPVRWGTGWATVSLRPSREILISLAGPCTGFLLASLVMVGVVAAGGSITVMPLFGVIPMPTVLLPCGRRAAYLFLNDLLWVNVFWGLMNLVPVHPLDGGNIARNLLIGANIPEATRKSMWLSLVVGALVAAGGLLLLRSTYVALLFGFLAFQSYQLLQQRTSL
jgi:stage IV sporulation protein FB